jgi:hypothetical protein
MAWHDTIEFQIGLMKSQVVFQNCHCLKVVDLICNERPIYLNEKTAMRLSYQRPLHVQGADSHLG